MYIPFIDSGNCKKYHMSSCSFTWSFPPQIEFTGCTTISCPPHLKVIVGCSYLLFDRNHANSWKREKNYKLFAYLNKKQSGYQIKSKGVKRKN
jgi:hypothetical protein